MLKSLGVIGVLGVLVVGCGSDAAPPTASTSTPEPVAPTPVATAEPFEKGHSRAVREYYGGGDAPVSPHGDVEAEYHQPPRPATGGIGETITLTGTNIGVRLRVTVTAVTDPVEASRAPRAGKRYVAVGLRLRSTGIAIYDGPLTNARLRYPGGAAKPATGVKAECSHGFQRTLRIDDQRPARGCLLFALPEDAEPDELLLALETVPAAAGGRWSLR
jgi:hypothetical protein